MSQPYTCLTLLATTLALTTANHLHAQGCVAARGSGMGHLHDAETGGRKWDLTVSHRFFESDRHFVGGHEEKQRRDEGSEVINRSHFTDLILGYHHSERLSFAVALPYVSHDRSQTLRDANRVVIHRFHTQATGVGDARIESNYLVFAPKPELKGNIQIGLGLALPTGKKNETDTYQTYDTTTKTFGSVVRTVDQSIQPGTGGYGILLSLGAYYNVLPHLRAYSDLSYAITPQETNGVPTNRGNPFESVMSIADTYLVRSGFEYEVMPSWGLTLSLGLRAEGVPIRDFIGGSNGFRRPGYSIAIEPGLTLERGTWNVRVFVPTAINRNRLRSVPDEQYTASSGVHRHGDAAFADSLVATSVTVRF